MSNSANLATKVTREIQRILHNNLGFIKNVDRQYDDQYKVDGAVSGTSMRIRLPNQYTVTTGKTLVAQDTTEKYVTLDRSTQKHVGMNFSMQELTTDFDNISERILKPAALRLAGQMDYDALAMTFDVYNQVGTAGTTPASAQVWLDAGAKLDNFATPHGDRTVVLNPKAQARTVDGLKGLFQDDGELAKQYKNGRMQRALGFSWAMDQNVRALTRGTRALGDTILVNGTLSTEGGTTISIDGGTGSATVVVGDIFTVADCYAVNPETKQSTGELQQFVVTAANTASGGAWTNIAISPPIYTTGALQTVDSFPQDGKAIVFTGTASVAYPENIVFYKDAFAFATIDLEMPDGVDFKSRVVHDGISIRVLRAYDINNDNLPSRLDVLYGYVTVRASQACRVIG